MLWLFSELALGTRFQYANRQKKVWVKIGANLIAEWDESQKTDNWACQKICCFQDREGGPPTYVNVL